MVRTGKGTFTPLYALGSLSALLTETYSYQINKFFVKFFYMIFINLIEPIINLIESKFSLPHRGFALA
jgi:hypothetical protein